MPRPVQTRRALTSLGAALLALALTTPAGAQTPPSGAPPAQVSPAQVSPAQAPPGEEARPVRIATEGAYPPFNTVDAGGQPAGFEVELGHALCAAARLACTFVVQEWDGLVDGLLERRYDAIMASLAITERRRARIAFSKPYYRIPAAFVAPKGTDITDTSPAGLEGRAIGTVERSEHQAYLEEVYPRSEVRLYGKFEEANLDLLAGRIDLVLGDKLALGRFLATREGACCRWLADVPPNKRFYGEGIGIGLRPDDTALRDAFDRAIDGVIADGTYDRIRARYLDFSTR